MILVTSPTGRTGTGRHVIQALHALGHKVRAFAHAPMPDQAEQGIAEVFVGDMLNKAHIQQACDGAEVVIHTGPMSGDEAVMGCWMIEGAKAAGVRHFVYHSVIHPQTEWLLNHQQKLIVEDRLIDSGLPFTILQPMHYFQNIDVRKSVECGVYATPNSPTSALSHVDVLDLAEVSAKIAGDPSHFYATYEICGNDHRTPVELAAAMSRVSGTPVRYENIPVDQFLAHFDKGPAHLSAVLARLMAYYNRFGIRGNSNVLTWLLGRAPTTLDQYIERMLGKTDVAPAGAQVSVKP